MRRTSFQWAFLANVSKAGNHIPACESPTSTMVFFPFGSPKVHFPTVAALKAGSHPFWSRTVSAWSAAASFKGGSMLWGNVVMAVAIATACSTWAVDATDDDFPDEDALAALAAGAE